MLAELIQSMSSDRTGSLLDGRGFWKNACVRDLQPYCLLQEHIMQKIAKLLLSVFLVTAFSGCAILETFGSVSSVSESVSKILDSFSDSLKSISNSLESSSQSSSGDKDKEKTEAFYRDVRSLIAVSVRERTPSTNLMRELGALARSHGVQDWEKMPGTMRAFGRGLQDGGLKKGDYALLRQSLGNRPRSLALLDQGYSGR